MSKSCSSEKSGNEAKEKERRIQSVVVPKLDKPNKNRGMESSQSEVTLYKRAVALSLDGDNPSLDNSPGDELKFNSSDEITISPNEKVVIPDNSIAEWNVDNRPKVREARNNGEHQCHHQEEPAFQDPRQRAEILIQQVEQAKARMMDVPGRNFLNQEQINRNTGDLLHSVIVDEGYSAVANHLDDNIRRTIMTGGYVDFAKLLPKDRIALEEDTRMEMVNRGGMSFWIPVSDRTSVGITSLTRWEQAFRIYLKVYVEGNPTQAEELIQYNHIIHEAAAEYPWDSVYSYDHEFRIHMSKFPTRNWGIILHQAWALKMRRHNYSSGNGQRNSPECRQNGHGNWRDNICWQYNLDGCTFGISCKFDHKCSLCGRWGHGAVNCCRA